MSTRLRLLIGVPLAILVALVGGSWIYIHLIEDPPAKLTTASLAADFAGAPKIGDWVEAHVDVHKVGGRLAFANCYLLCNGERIVHASAVFARSGDRPAG